MKYVVRYELDADGWWYTKIPAIQGCHTQGATLSQAEERIRECLGLFIHPDDANEAFFEHDIVLPKEVSDALATIAGFHAPPADLQTLVNSRSV